MLTREVFFLSPSGILLLNIHIIAATRIQSLYRMFSCPGVAVWATRMAKQRILYNAAVERKDRQVDAAKTREDFQASLLKDSASESDEADDWCEFWNDAKDCPFWYSDEHRVTTFYSPYERKLEKVGGVCCAQCCFSQIFFLTLFFTFRKVLLN